MSPVTAAATPPPGTGLALPLALHLGFAGPRRLAPADAPWSADALAQLRTELHRVLAGVPAALGLRPQHFLVGVSQLAIGADTVFTEALAELGWPQRVLLPQPLGDYLAAQGSAGPDFDAGQQQHARRLLDSPRIAEVAVASTADSRAERFEETNLRLLGECDLLVLLQLDDGLRPPDARDRPGGTAELLQRARSRRLRRLVLTLGRGADGQPRLQADWEHSLDAPAPLPQLPAFLHGAALPPGPLPDATRLLPALVQQLKQAASAHAQQRQGLFQRGAGVVVVTHVAATALALLALKAPMPPWLTLVVLGSELVLLAVGFATHHHLHHSRATHGWALARLGAELARAAHALRGLPIALPRLQQQAFPEPLQPLLRTLHVLHQQACRQAPQDWQAVRQRYLAERLRAPQGGQIAYYQRETDGAHRTVRRAARIFTAASVLAFVATGVKAALTAWGGHDAWHAVTAVAGPLAILLPVVAVGAMSMAAAFDAEARAHTFGDTLRFTQEAAEQIAQASSPGEFTALVLQLESRLLGETLAWVGRRVHLGIS